MYEITEKLEEMFMDVEDITEPSSIDKVLMVLEDIRSEEDRYMQLLVSALENSIITWELPWYQMSTSLTRKPKIPDDISETYNTGPFTKEESDRIEKNWLKLVKKYNIPNTPIHLARWRNRSTKSKFSKTCPEEYVRYFVIAYLARRVKRDLYQVNRYFFQTYGCPVKYKMYSAVEEKIMEICFYHDPRNATLILSSVLGREPRRIYVKLAEYYNGKPDEKRIKWTLCLAKKFVRKLMLHSGCSLSGLKNNKFHKEVWLELEKEMGQQYGYLRAFWYGKLHAQLFTQCTIKCKTLRKLIFKQLMKSSYQRWSEIKWKEVVCNFPDGFTDMFLYRMVYSLIRYQPNYMKMPLPEVIKKVKHHMKHTKRNRRLKNVYFDEDGRLQYVKYDQNIKHVMSNN